MSSAVYDKGEPFLYGKRATDYDRPIWWSNGFRKPSLSGYLFSRYVLQSDQLVLKRFWRVVRVIPLAHIEKVMVWFRWRGARAKVMMIGTDATIVLCTDHPILLAEAFDRLHVKVEAIEPEIMVSEQNDAGET